MNVPVNIASNLTFILIFLVSLILILSFIEYYVRVKILVYLFKLTKPTNLNYILLVCLKKKQIFNCSLRGKIHDKLKTLIKRI